MNKLSSQRGGSTRSLSFRRFLKANSSLKEKREIKMSRTVVDMALKLLLKTFCPNPMTFEYGEQAHL